MAVETANEHDVPISMCGQMCGNPLYTMLLVGHGPAEPERHAGGDPRNQAHLPQRRTAAMSASDRAALKFDSAHHVRTYLKEELSKVVPDIRI